MSIKTKQKKKKQKKNNNKNNNKKQMRKMNRRNEKLEYMKTWMISHHHSPSPITLITTSHPQPISHPVLR